MTMERRWGLRKSVGVDVVIDNQPACLLRGHIDNVSVGGVYIKTESAALRKNAQVELVLMLQQGPGTRVYRMPAMVVRLTANGAGLMFDQYDVNAFRALVVLLLAQQKAAVVKASLSEPVSTASADTTNPLLNGEIEQTLNKVSSFLPAFHQPSPVHGE